MNEKNCEFCLGSSKYVRSPVKDYRFWRVELHHSQYYLGRCVVILRRHLEDFFDINTEERDELFQAINYLRSSIATEFKPDLFNYASLGNIVPHVHLHVIPRYKHPVTFGDTVFSDENWGKNYAPYNREFSIPENLYDKISNAIAIHLEK